MTDDEAFHELLSRVRSGDAEAAAELVRRYEPLIRFEARLRLTDPRLRRLWDSLDICQSVLASFFVRAAAGQYDLERPEQMVKLLVQIARNKVASKARRQHCRDADRKRDESANVEELEGVVESGRQEANQELLREVQQRLTGEERRLVGLRGQGRTWAEVASELGGTAEGRRKQLQRALDLVAQQLGID